MARKVIFLQNTPSPDVFKMRSVSGVMVSWISKRPFRIVSSRVWVPTSRPILVPFGPVPSRWTSIGPLDCGVSRVVFEVAMRPDFFSDEPCFQNSENAGSAANPPKEAARMGGSVRGARSKIV